MIRAIRGLAIVATVAASLSASADTTLGFLEEAPQPQDSSTLQTNLRVAFRKVAGVWKPACESKGSPPWDRACSGIITSANDWTVLDGGVAMGTVKTVGWLSEDRYAAEGLLRLTSPAPASTGPRTADFTGWHGVDVHRPLVAINGGSPRASVWKPANTTAPERSRIFDAFKKIVPRFPRCKDEKGKQVQRSSVTGIKDVEFIRPMQASDGRKLIGVRIAPQMWNDCDGAGSFASTAWFYLAQDGAIRTLPRRRDGEWPEFTIPIDISDFDGDGKEEAVFWFSGYNEDGYLLFDQDFKRVVRFTWGYH